MASGRPHVARAEARRGQPLVGDGAERSNIRDLPGLGHLAVTKVGDHGLVDPEATSRSLETGEARRHRARHNHTSHLDRTLDDDLPHVVAEIWHSGKRIPPDRFLIVDRSGRKTERRVDDYIAMKQLIESVEIARITGSQPSKHHRSTTIDHRTTVTRPAARATGNGHRSSTRGRNVFAKRAALPTELRHARDDVDQY
jgi:hypothetical protein